MTKNKAIIIRLGHMVDAKECTQGEIARFVKVSQPTISRYLSGKTRVDYETTLKLVQFAERKKKQIAAINNRVEKIA